MNQFSNQRYVEMIKAYNEEFSRVFNRLIEENPASINECADQEEFPLKNSVHNSLQEWFAKPLLIAGQTTTPDAIIDSIGDLDEAIELAAYAAVFCDDDIPDRIKIKLGSFGQPAVKQLEQVAAGSSWESRRSESGEPEPTLVISTSFIKLLAEWECFDQYAAMIAKLASSTNPDELIAEAVRQYLIALGEAAAPALVQSINDCLAARSDLNSAGEYLLIALTDIGRNARNEDTFSCLKSCFRVMKNKVIGAICIGDYGDGRGVQVLKGWLDRNPLIDDRQLISEILSSIKRLGGEIADVQHRLKLNQQQKIY